MSAHGFAISKLIEAIRQGHIHGVIRALDGGCDIEEADQHGHPGLPLRTACFSGKPEIVHELIKRGANVNAAGSDGPNMPLRLALRARNADIVRLLLANGAEVPAGLTVPAEYLVPPEKPSELPPEFPPMEFETAPKVSSREDFLPEHPASSPATEAPAGEKEYHILEEVDITANYGLDTNLLNMDMERFNEDADKTKQSVTAEQKKGGLWKSGRHS